MKQQVIAISTDIFLLCSLRLLLATILGGIIGYLRERKRKPAGIKTHAYVCLGSCLIMILGLQISQELGGEPTRMAAQVVSGIGFLGAGTIITSSTRITGLTSAAGLWFTACLGLAIGSDFFWLAIPTMICYFIIAIIFAKFDLAPIDEDELHH